MKTLIPILVEELAAGRPVALATVLQSKGSAPRGAGACQMLMSDGCSAGTVGGGILERRALDELHTLLLSGRADFPKSSLGTQAPDKSAECFFVSVNGRSQVQEYALTQNDAQSLGMVCGGNVSLLYQLLEPVMLPLFRLIQDVIGSGHSLWLVRKLSQGCVTYMGITDRHQNPSPLPDKALFALCGHKPVWSGDDVTADRWFVEPLILQSHAYIFGGGHVAQCVSPLLAQLDFSPIVYDDRPEFSTPALFPTATGVVCAPFSEMGDRLHFSADDEIVIMTRGHANDLDILKQALQTPAYYIGLIGSRTKIAHTRGLLLEAGYSDADFARIHTPIGLPILAETPMEIAVSVAAEMILCRAKHAEESGSTPNSISISDTDFGV